MNKLTIRQSVIDLTRQFFKTNGFVEITVPLLQTSLPNEPNIYPFTTDWTESRTKNKKLLLAPSPESSLKKIISQDPKNYFSISPSFRNLENIGPHHQPEFLMLEWYEMNKNYQNIIETTKKYLDFVFQKKLNYQNIILPKNLPTNEPDFNQYFLNNIETQLSTDPTFITGYPAFLSPLSKENERFELYLDKVEIANGCTENQKPDIPVPWGKIPPCAGCGLGLDRLAMIMAGSTSLNDILYFPF